MSPSNMDTTQGDMTQGRMHPRHGPRPAGSLGSPLIWGHRGAGHRGDDARLAENTIAAFEAARAAGADGVELDVRLCATGEVVVFHDDDLARLAGRPGRVDGLSLSALRDLRLRGDTRIATLDEVFEALGPSWRINVEIKPVAMPRTAALVAAVLACIDRHRAREQVLVSSFDPVILGQVRLRAPGLATGYLFHREQGLPLRRAWPARLLRPAALHPDHGLITRARVRTWHRRGWAVNAWTVDDAMSVRALAALGVDGIITNDPAGARAALAARA